MQLDDIIRQKDVLTLLHSVLEQEKTIRKISVFSPNGEKYGYNQYSLLIIMDFLIKYQIIIEEEYLIKDMLIELKKICEKFESHQELVIYLNNLLAELTRMKLGLLEKDSKEGKKAILKYIYDKYIVHGYCFHSFPSVFKESIENNGITPQQYQDSHYNMKQIAYIFEHHHYKNIITKNLKNKSTYIALTDSPAMAYFHAFNSPEYFSNLTATGKYMKDETSYDREAYYRKDKTACEKNMRTLCNKARLTEKETNSVMEAFENQWNNFNASNSLPCIAFIKRKELGKDYLEDIDEILKRCNQEDLIFSIARITDSRYPCLRRYHSIARDKLEIQVMPSYREIKQNEFILPNKNKEQIEKEISLSKEKPKKNQMLAILVLLGLLFIALGCTLIILLRRYGGT